MAAGLDDLVDVEARLEAIQQVRPTPRISSRSPPVSSAFSNILKQAKFSGAGRVDASPARGRSRARPLRRISAHRDVGSSRSQRQRSNIAALRPQVDLFFDKVLVNAPDAARPAEPADCC